MNPIHIMKYSLDISSHKICILVYHSSLGIDVSVQLSIQLLNCKWLWLLDLLSLITFTTSLGTTTSSCCTLSFCWLVSSHCSFTTCSTTSSAYWGITTRQPFTRVLSLFRSPVSCCCCPLSSCSLRRHSWRVYRRSVLLYFVCSAVWSEKSITGLYIPDNYDMKVTPLLFPPLGRPILLEEAFLIT